ncbi:MAG: hypothetical protein NT115_11405 [Proteobacteria bacterium]|nr:hypothetical protein [Pseudomonadota bacterium]
MPPRGSRLACSLHSIDGCVGSFDVFPGEAPKSIARVGPVKWDKPPQKEVQQAAFSVIGEMGMTGTVLVLNQYQWRALTVTKLEEPFYGMILWGGSPLKVVEDASALAAKRGG